MESSLTGNSVWDLLVQKTVSKRLDTAESLLSLFAEMQAVLMELKNLAEQSLTREKPEEDSVSVTLTPIMSSVLGMSQVGGVTRYVLPQSQIPHRYHELLNFNTGVSSSISTSTQTNLVSPESTTSTIQQEEENSQMSLDVSLEDNLSTRQGQNDEENYEDEEEEIQDYSLNSQPHSPVTVSPHKRQRLDSISSPPSRTEDSDLSSISTAVTEVTRGQELESPEPGEGETDQLVSEDVEEIRGGVTTPSLSSDQNHSGEATTPTPTASSSQRPSQSSYSVPSARPESLGGSQVNYGALQLVPHSGRCSLDTTGSSPPPPPEQPGPSHPSGGVRPDNVEVGEVSSGKIMVHLLNP